MRSRPAELWIGAALGANLFLSAIILVARGAGVHGTEAALFATGRVAFLWFWAAYAGGPLTTLFGATFLPLKQRGREFGLAFAAALLVHLALVGWLCWIGAAPPIDVFIRFGPAAAFAILLALFSFGNLHALLGPKGWQLLRVIGMNYILYVFLYDFWQDPLHGGILRLVAYLPFTVMAIAAALLQLAAWGVRLRVQHRYAQLAEAQSPNYHLNSSIKALRYGPSESDLRRAGEGWHSP
jgi:hypothetical protein